VFQKIPIKLCPRRPGDATAVYASTEKAKKELGWKYVVITFFPCIEVALPFFFFQISSDTALTMDPLYYNIPDCPTLTMLLPLIHG